MVAAEIIAAAAAAEMLADGRCQMRLQLAAAAAATLAEAPSPAARRQLARQQAAVALSRCRKTKRSVPELSAARGGTTRGGTVDEAS